ncbi:hypothetical protein Tco_1491234 [Tanacetum coccineum]
MTKAQDQISQSMKEQAYNKIKTKTKTQELNDKAISISPRKPNGDALRKCILKGPYTPTIVTTPVVPATEDSPAVPEQTTVETVMNMTPENRAHFESEKSYSIDIDWNGEEIYSSCMIACQISFKKTLGSHRKATTRFVTIVKQQHKLDEVSYHKLFDILKQYQKEVNELRAERMAKNANPLALVATAQTLQDPYYQTSKPHKSYAPTSKASLPTRSHATTRYKGKEIAKPITPPSELASEEDSDPEQAQKDKDMQKNLALIAKNDKQTGQFGNTERRNVVGARKIVGGPVVQQYKPAEKGVPLQAEQSDWLADTDEEIDEHDLEAHYSTEQRFHEFLMQTSVTDA